MKKVAFHNLGCKVNSYETEVMMQNLKEYGFEIVPFEQMADLYIVNTCSVTNMADRKSRQMLHRAKKKNPEAVVVAVGCYVQSADPEALREAGVDLAIGNNRKKELLSTVLAYLQDEGRLERMVPVIAEEQEYENLELKEATEHSRAYIKIQDGCNQFCSYCIIPYVRGRIRSRKPEDILQEVRRMAELGIKEVVLTGIHLSSYGVDFIPKEERDPKNPFAGSPGLLEMIRMVHEICGIERIRLGSLEPRIVTDEFAEGIAALPKVCPHFHLSLQSGSGETLKRMNRHYSPEQFYEGVERLRRVYDDPAITTDVIVGFPGETEGEFEETKAFLEKVSFYEMHIFKYSRRNGTVADRMKEQVPEIIKTKRSEELFVMEHRCSLAFRERRLGKTVEVLLEETMEKDGKIYTVGHTKEYIRVAVEGEYPANSILSGRAVSMLADDLILMEN